MWSTDVFKGVVSGLQQRAESSGGVMYFVWDFRLERRDEKGESLPRVAVQMRGRTLSGSIANGDQVEVSGRRHNGVLMTSRVRNLTSNSIVIAQSTGLLSKLFGALIMLMIFAFFIFVMLNIQDAKIRFDQLRSGEASHWPRGHAAASKFLRLTHRHDRLWA